jgi:DNA-binding NarL/FixJ family response regulator
MGSSPAPRTRRRRWRSSRERSPSTRRSGIRSAARALLALGVVRRRDKQKRPAREAIEAALEGFETVGAEGWAEKARAELGRVGGRRPSDGELTPTELRLAELVAEGRSNKEIAAALFVTPKTVGTTLSRLYAKLGVHSRTELIRHLAEQPPTKV